MSSTTALTDQNQMSSEEWQQRVELAAAFRLGDRFGWTELVWNHITARVPGEPDHFLINPLGLRWDEMSASKLLKVGVDGEVITGEGIAPKAGFVIHSAVHEARADVHACMHTHTNDGIAVSALTDGLLPVCHEALYFHDNVGYHECGGASMDVEERDEIAHNLGGNSALILRNHGLLTVGETVAEAFTMMYWLQRACEIQMKVLASNRPWRVMAPEIGEKFQRQLKQPRDIGESFYPGALEFPALVRQLDQSDPSYRD